MEIIGEYKTKSYASNESTGGVNSLVMELVIKMTVKGGEEINMQ
jgi:hypothetical protein